VSAVSGILSTNDKLAPVSVTIVGGVVGCSIGNEIGRKPELEAISSSSFFFFSLDFKKNRFSMHIVVNSFF
jgi:hypothetical protein